MNRPPPIDEVEALKQRVENDFTYYQPTPEKIVRLIAIREAGKALALAVVANCPRGREQSTALTMIETACFHANAGIARSPA